MVFSPSGYLRGLGWTPGEPLNDAPGARAKPITVHQKKTLAGVGKDRDTAFPWWEMVFATVATKVSGGKTNDHHRTSTGIISPLPPPKQSAYVPLAAATSGGINQSALATAKIEAARRQLYSGFLRGSVLGSSLEEEEKEMERVAEEKLKGKVGAKDKGKGKEVGREKGEKKKRKRSKGEDSEGEDGEVKLSKEERRAAKKQRKENRVVVATTTASIDPSSVEEETVVVRKKSKKSKSTEDDSSKPSKSKRSKSGALKEHLSPEEHITEDELAYAEAREIAKRAAKEEKRLAKVVKKALKESK